MVCCFLRVTGFGGGGWESGQREECAIGEREACRPGAAPIEREEEVEKECRECRVCYELRAARSSRVRSSGRWQKLDLQNSNSICIVYKAKLVVATYLRNRPPTLSHTQRPHSPTVPVPFTARGLAAAGPGLLASIGLPPPTRRPDPIRLVDLS